jgi:hypothetical protein
MSHIYTGVRQGIVCPKTEFSAAIYGSADDVSHEPRISKPCHSVMRFWHAAVRRHTRRAAAYFWHAPGFLFYPTNQNSNDVLFLLLPFHAGHVMALSLGITRSVFYDYDFIFFHVHAQCLPRLVLLLLLHCPFEANVSHHSKNLPLKKGNSFMMPCRDISHMSLSMPSSESAH